MHRHDRFSSRSDGLLDGPRGDIISLRVDIHENRLCAYSRDRTSRRYKRKRCRYDLVFGADLKRLQCQSQRVRPRSAADGMATACRHADLLLERLYLRPQNEVLALEHSRCCVQNLLSYLRVLCFKVKKRHCGPSCTSKCFDCHMTYPRFVNNKTLSEISILPTKARRTTAPSCVPSGQKRIVAPSFWRFPPIHNAQEQISDHSCPVCYAVAHLLITPQGRSQLHQGHEAQSGSRSRDLAPLLIPLRLLIPPRAGHLPKPQARPHRMIRKLRALRKPRFA